jgi:hypothetical protein
LHGLVRGAITQVNPDTLCMLQRSAGWDTASDGRQVPIYSPPQQALFQIQAATGDDLKQIDGLNIQGVHRALFAYGDLAAVIRPAQVGGDLVIMPDSTIWLMTMALEPWQGQWCKMAITQQLNAAIIALRDDVFILGAPA